MRHVFLTVSTIEQDGDDGFMEETAGIFPGSVKECCDGG